MAAMAPSERAHSSPACSGTSDCAPRRTRARGAQLLAAELRGLRAAMPDPQALTACTAKAAEERFAATRRTSTRGGSGARRDPRGVREGRLVPRWLAAQRERAQLRRRSPNCASPRVEARRARDVRARRQRAGRALQSARAELQQLAEELVPLAALNDELARVRGAVAGATPPRRADQAQLDELVRTMERLQQTDRDCADAGGGVRELEQKRACSRRRDRPRRGRWKSSSPQWVRETGMPRPSARELLDQYDEVKEQRDRS